MARSLRLALYLATRQRLDQRADAARSEADRERQGRTTLRRPAGPLVWFHVGQDGQALAQHELARRMLQERDDLTFLITTNAEDRPDPEPHVHWQFAPLDSQGPVRRFLDHWRPSVALWSEPDLRAVLITEAADRGIPLHLVGTRGSARSTASNWLRAMGPELLLAFDSILAGDEAARAALIQLGAKSDRVELAGFLEEGAPALGCDEAERDRLAQILRARPSWAAVDVNALELPILMQAHQRAQGRAHRLLMILVPDDIALGPAWAAQLREDGHAVALRSAGEDPEAEIQVYVADVADELGLWYRLAPISFLGQSFSTGHVANPFEAAALGSAIVHGPLIGAHPTAFDRLKQADAARMALDAADLGEAIDALLSPALVAAMAHRAWQVSSDGAEVTDRVIDLLLTEVEAL